MARVNWKVIIVVLLALSILAIQRALAKLIKGADWTPPDHNEWFHDKHSDAPADYEDPTYSGETYDPELQESLMSEQPKEERDVVILNKNNFDFVVGNEKIIMVYFYAPWCQQCMDLFWKYEAAAKRLKQHQPPLKMAKVDGTIQRGLAWRFQLRGYPSLKYFVNGRAYDYTASTEEDNLVEFMVERGQSDFKHQDEYLHALDDHNFTDSVENTELMMIMFYAPWDPNSKKLLPEFAKAAKLLSQKSPPIPLAKVDCVDNPELASKYGIEDKFPSLKVFRKGFPYEYKGAQFDWAIVDYMLRQVGEATKEVKTAKDLKKMVNEDDITVVGFFEQHDDPMFNLFSGSGHHLREDFKFLHTFSKELRKKYEATVDSFIVLHAERFWTEWEPKWHLFKMDTSPKLEDITKFIEDHQVPLAGQLTWESRHNRYTKRPLCIAFFTIDWGFDLRETTQLWRKKIASVAKEFMDIVFAIADEDQVKDLFKHFGFDDSGEEMNFGCIDQNDKKFPMKPMDQYDANMIKGFVEEFKKGGSKPHYKSQTAPKSLGPGHVIHVVGSTFEKIVMDPTKDVIIEFSAPWCGQCKRLEPKWRDLAKKYRHEKNLVIAKMDAVANESPANFPVDSYPTIYFASRTNKQKPVKMPDLPIDINCLIKFIKKHATVSLHGPLHYQETKKKEEL